MKALMFPGQGSQYPGMGKEIYESNPEAKKIYDKANEVLNFDIKETIFNGNEDQLKETMIAQLGIYITSIAILNSKYIRNKYHGVAGHSLGEYSALTAAGSLKFEDGLKLIYIRAQAMEKASKPQNNIQYGMMAILGLDDEKIKDICGNSNEKIFAANFNSPGQVIISGIKNDLTFYSDIFMKAGAKKVVFLNVSGAFHSPYIKAAEEELKAALLNTYFYKPQCKIYQNYTSFSSDDTKIIRNNLLNQLCNPVLWCQSITNMKKDGFTEFEECGPSQVLTKLLKRIK